MKLHRYYIHDMELTHTFWMQDSQLFHQWITVLRYQDGREVVLFNSNREERLYRLAKIGNDAVQLEMVTELTPKLPKKDIYLCFAMLKKDKNEWVLQKGTELGVSHFVPLLTDRTEKTGWNRERAEKIVIEASEQCGRSDIPSLREPITPLKIIEELDETTAIFIAQQGADEHIETKIDSLAVLIGPEGGWSNEEIEAFNAFNIKHVGLSDFTLRAETAAIIAVTKFS